MTASCIAIYPAAQLLGIHANGVEPMRPPQFKVAEQSHVRYAVWVKIGIRVAKGACLGSKESLSNHPSSAQCTRNMAYSESFDMLATENNDTTSREAWVKTAFHSFRQEQPRVGTGPGSANGGLPELRRYPLYVAPTVPVFLVLPSVVVLRILAMSGWSVWTFPSRYSISPNCCYEMGQWEFQLQAIQLIIHAHGVPRPNLPRKWSPMGYWFSL